MNDQEERRQRPRKIAYDPKAIQYLQRVLATQSQQGGAGAWGAVIAEAQLSGISQPRGLQTETSSPRVPATAPLQSVVAGPQAQIQLMQQIAAKLDKVLADLQTIKDSIKNQSPIGP